MKTLLFILLITFIPLTQAGTVTAIGVGRSVVNASTGVATAEVYFKSKQASNASTFLRKTVQVSKASMGAIIKRRAFSPYGAAFVVAAVAAGYYFDQASGDITSPAGSTVSLVIPALQYCLTDNTSCANSWQSNYDTFSSPHRSVCGQDVTISTSSTYETHSLGKQFPGGNCQSGVIRHFLTGSCPATYTLSNGACVASVPTVVPDAELYDSLEPYISPNDLNRAFDDDIASDPIAVPEIAAAAAAAQLEQDALNDADPNNDPINPTETQTAQEQQVEQQEKTNSELESLNEQIEELNTNLSADGAPTADTLDSTSDVDNIFDIVSNDISGIGSTALINSPVLSVSDYIKGTGTCVPFVLDAGRYGSISMVPFCTIYDSALRDLMEWFLYGVMVITIFYIFHDTVSRVSS